MWRWERRRGRADQIREITFAEKARLYEEAIDKFHRRTEFGYVLGARAAGGAR
jgi:hypothetical protein